MEELERVLAVLIDSVQGTLNQVNAEVLHKDDALDEIAADVSQARAQLNDYWERIRRAS